MEFILKLEDSLLPIIEKNIFLDVTCKKDIINFSYKDKIIGSVVSIEASKLFKLRKKLKAVFIKIENNDATVKIIRFADLHRHSGYSLLDGASTIDSLVANTEYVGAITDHGVMFGTLEFYKKMIKVGKKPIIGFEAYTESMDEKKNSHHLILLAKNTEGFNNLMKLTSMGYTNFYNKPNITYKMLKSFSSGIIATSACLGGEISQHLIKGDYSGAKIIAEELSSIYGKENFYIEIQRHHIMEEDIVNPLLIKLAEDCGLKLIATTDSHFTNKEDFEVHEMLLCLNTGTTMLDENRFKFPGTGYHIHTADEMDNLFSDIPEALTNTLEIAEKCTFEFELGNISMPKFEIPVLFSSENEYFEHLCNEGFENRFKGTTILLSKEYKDRLQFEIEMIKKTGFAGYFLIVNDFVMFAVRNNILVGPGRGSACGSIVAYVLNITQIDPIPYGLLFERFLNVDRISMPDIDLDFDDERREEVINYVKSKYGEYSVSRIITFGTMAARAVTKDIARAMGKPYSVGDRISKAIPDAPKMTLKKALEGSIELKRMYEDEPEVTEIINNAMKLEGLPKNISSHACGVIIAPSRVDNFIPQILVEDKDTHIKELTTQYTMNECEEMGLLKMDFLGLRTMGVIAKSLKDINKKRKNNSEPEITDFMDIPITDSKVYDFISKGNTEGVFQLESAGMTSFMKELFQDAHKYVVMKNETKAHEIGKQLFERAIAGISLYRPGPIDEIPNYIKNMLHQNSITYETPLLEPILKATYGIIVYQEQVMFIVSELAGFSKGQADNIRKAMGKKKTDILKEYEEYFINGSEQKDKKLVKAHKSPHNIVGCIKNGVSESIARSIWAKMEKFGLYAFNKSHAAGYAEIAIRTAWLAYYYPVEYMCATLNSFITKAERVKIYMSVCKKKGLKVLSPDVNLSNQLFTVDEDSIRFGLMGIRNMGKSSYLVIDERNNRNKFENFQKFAERMAIHQKVDKKLLEALIYSSAVDTFKGTRRAKIEMLDKILESASYEKKLDKSGQIDIFSLSPEFEIYKTVTVPNIPEFEKKFKLEKEKEFAGFYITEHPLDDYISYFEREKVLEIGFLNGSEDDEVIISDEEDNEVSKSNDYDGEIVKIAGIINDLKIFYTKKDNKPLYVFNVEDRTGEMKAVIFADKIAQNQNKLVEGKVVIVQGTLKKDDFGAQVMVRNIFDVGAIVKSEKPKSIWFKISESEQFNEIEKLVNANKGDIPVKIRYNNKNYQSEVGGMNLSVKVFENLRENYGENFKIVY